MLMQERNDHDRVFKSTNGAHRPKWMGGILAYVSNRTIWLSEANFVHQG